MQRVWSADELGERWSLLPEDLVLLAGRVDAGKLGFAVQLAFWRQHGRFPDDEADVAPAVIAHLAGQIGIGVDALDGYAWSSRPPSTHIAAGPGSVWCWDMTFLPAQVQGRWFYLYLILDLYSRKVVGFEVQDTDSADHAAHLARRTALAEGVHAMPVRPVLHGDNGATLKATTVLAMLHWLGIQSSYSRPRVSDDNAFAEALFRTAKYRPEFPGKGFAHLEAARAWAVSFVHWYNHEHRHSGIRYVTPAQRHSGQDGHMLAERHALYQVARERNPRRWSRQTRDWTPVGAVTLNPERQTVVAAALSDTRLSRSIGEPAFSS